MRGRLFASINTFQKAGFIVCSITVSPKQHSGHFNLKFQFEISLFFSLFFFVQMLKSSGLTPSGKITIVAFEHFHDIPSGPPPKNMPPDIAVSHGEVEGHRH